jgi:ribonuclease HI
MKINIWTDGSYNRHNNKCACAFVIKTDFGFYHEQNFELTEGKLSTNVAEMTGIIKALEFLLELNDTVKNADITVISDSQYCTKGISEWIFSWKAKAWQNVKNKELWKYFDKLVYKSGFSNIQFEWVRGHTGVEENERCDLLCGVITSTKAEKLREKI